MASGQSLQLLGNWMSPTAARVRIALALKGLPYEYLEQNLRTKSDLLLRSNPVFKRVPVLIHGGRTICESQIILQYIDDVWPSAGPPIVPADPYDRAVARFWGAYIDDEVFPTVQTVFWSRTAEAKAEAADKAGVEFRLMEEAFKKCSGGKPFFGGDGIGFLDIVLGSYLSLIEVTQRLDGVSLLGEVNAPELALWGQRFIAEESVRGALPDIDVLMERSIAHRNANPAASR